MSPQLSEDAQKELELTKDGVKLVSVTFGINLYTNCSFYDSRREVLTTFDLFRERIVPATFNYYATETMKVHKPVTKRALAMLATWLAPDAPRKNYVALELKSSRTPQDAPELKYETWADEGDPSRANIVSLALPASVAEERPKEIVAFVRRLADVFPFRCGLAGLTFECSRYNKKASETHAWRMSMRHRGIDIVRIPYDAKAVGTDGIRGVNWLTLLDSNLVKELGGTKALRGKLSADIDLIACEHGIIVQAGAAPTAGDVNRGETLPLYREVYAVLAPWIEIAAKRSMAFQLVDEFVERTEAWYRRLGT